MRNLPPLYLYALQESEIELLRQIVVESVTGEEKLFRQSQFMGDGGDIRNFIKTPNARPNPQFLASIYNYVMTNIYPQLSSININHMSSKTKMILSLIDDLISLGIKSGRYQRDITIYMDNFIDGNMAEQNVAPKERGSYIGYRYSTDKLTIIRFFVHIYYDGNIDRTRFRSVARLPGQLRDTIGFSYGSVGNTYLSGFINGGIGCEFMAFKNAAHVALRTGVVMTTSSNSSPTAKRCLLVQTNRTSFSELADDNKDKYSTDLDWNYISGKMVTADLNEWQFDIDAEIRNRVDLEQYVDASNMIQV